MLDQREKRELLRLVRALDRAHYKVLKYEQVRASVNRRIRAQRLLNGRQRQLAYFMSDEPSWFINHYTCPRCKHQWDDRWTATCDDDCPECGLRHITPTHSDDA